MSSITSFLICEVWLHLIYIAVGTEGCVHPKSMMVHPMLLSHFSHVRLCDPMDCSPTASTVHGILQARILERVAIPSSRESSWLGIKPVSPVSCTAGEFFTAEPPGKPRDRTIQPTNIYILYINIYILCVCCSLLSTLLTYLTAFLGLSLFAWTESKPVFLGH